MGVHEWCEIRLIRPQGRLALCEESGRIWYSWWAFWLLFAQIKSDQKNDNLLNLGLPPQTRVTFFLDKKVTKKSRLMIFLLQVTFVVCHAIQAITLRFISGCKSRTQLRELLTRPSANTTALTCYAKISCAVWNPSKIIQQ